MQQAQDYLPLAKSLIHTLFLISGTIRLIKSRSKSLLLIPKSTAYYLKLLFVLGIFLCSVGLSITGNTRQQKFEYGLDSFCFLFAGLVHHVEYSYSAISSTILLFYWLFMFFGEVSMTVFEYVHVQEISPTIYTLMVSCIGILVVFILELVPKPKSLYQHIDEEDNMTPEATSNIFSRLTFHWMTSLMKLGRRKVLSMDDLWTLKEDDTTDYNSKKFQKYFDLELQKKKYNN